MSLHKDMTGADLHEPKGVASATSGQVYEADGLGSGVWTTLTIPAGTFHVSTTQFTSSGTWTKPAGLFIAKVYVIAGGGLGITALANNSVAAGSNSSFGSHCSATGGSGGATTGGVSIPGTGGTGSSGNQNYTGTTGLGATVGVASVYYAGGLSGGPIPSKGVGGNALGDGTLISAAGGGGGFSSKWILAATLGATESVTVGSAGMNNGIVVVEEFIAD